MPEPNPPLVIFSGGQDSTTCLYWARREFGHTPDTLTINYGQRHQAEVEAAKAISSLAGIRRGFSVQAQGLLQGRSPLIDPTELLERYDSFQGMAEIIGDRVEHTFVPLRNLLFLVLAANRAAAFGYTDIVLGICEEDTANYPDCRAGFLRRASEAINWALGKDRGDQGPEIAFHAPLLTRTKAQTVNLAWTLPGCAKALAWSHTAYDGSFPPKGDDHASLLRAQGFLSAGKPDPLILRAYLLGLIPTLPDTPNYRMFGPEPPIGQLMVRQLESWLISTGAAMEAEG